MKLTLASVLFSVMFSMNVNASSSLLDGCYQMYQPGSMHPAFCLQGMAEESLGGAGVRLVAFKTNTSRIAACLKSSSLKGTANSLEFIVGKKKEMILSNIKYLGMTVEGDATFGSTTLKFMKLGKQSEDHLLAVFYEQRKCQNLEIGSFVVLNK